MTKVSLHPAVYRDINVVYNSNRRPYDCHYCGKLFKSSRDLKQHVRTHTGAKPYSCRHCSERFTWPDTLKAHLLKSHNEGTWFTCHIFQKKFTRICNLWIHILRHEGGLKRMFAVNVHIATHLVLVLLLVTNTLSFQIDSAVPALDSWSPPKYNCEAPCLTFKRK